MCVCVYVCVRVWKAVHERNYHIFYQMISGSTPEQKQKLSLTSLQDYHYLNQVIIISISVNIIIIIIISIIIIIVTISIKY